MTLSQILLLLSIGLAAGIIGGGLGVGGGIIVIPALVFFLGFSQHTAQGTNVFMMLPPIGILAVYNYYQKGLVDVKAALILMIAFIIGAYFGSKVAIFLPEKIVKKIFAIMLFLTSLKIFFGK